MKILNEWEHQTLLIGMNLQVWTQQNKKYIPFLADDTVFSSRKEELEELVKKAFKIVFYGILNLLIFRSILLWMPLSPTAFF